MNSEYSEQLQVATHWAKTFIAADFDHAKQVLRRFCFDVSYCVTVDQTTYIYKGGEEKGIVVGLINCPRFPDEPGAIDNTAGIIADILMKQCGQKSYTIMTPEKTTYYSRKL